MGHPEVEGTSIQAVARGISLSEQLHNLLRIAKTGYGTNQQEHEAHLDTKPKSLAYTCVQPGSIIEPANRLEALAETDEERIDEHPDARHDGHPRNGRIAIRARRHIEQHGGQAGQPLAGQRRRTSAYDLLYIK